MRTVDESLPTALVPQVDRAPIIAAAIIQVSDNKKKLKKRLITEEEQQLKRAKRVKRAAEKAVKVPNIAAAAQGDFNATDMIDFIYFFFR